MQKGVYNAIVAIDGIPYRLNRSQGLMPATEHDIRAWPNMECPFVEELRSAAEALGHPSPPQLTGQKNLSD
jgi:hypothetical protein